jgi:hypothetical protein
MERRYTPLGEVAIPLGPDRLLLPCQVERVDDLAPPPAVVARRPRADPGVSAMREVA